MGKRESVILTMQCAGNCREERIDDLVRRRRQTSGERPYGPGVAPDGRTPRRDGFAGRGAWVARPPPQVLGQDLRDDLRVLLRDAACARQRPPSPGPVRRRRPGTVHPCHSGPRPVLGIRALLLLYHGGADCLPLHPPTPPPDLTPNIVAHGAPHGILCRGWAASRPRQLGDDHCLAVLCDLRRLCKILY